jgi:hypothetical protein
MKRKTKVEILFQGQGTNRQKIPSLLFMSRKVLFLVMSFSIGRKSTHSMFESLCLCYSVILLSVFWISVDRSLIYEGKENQFLIIGISAL